MPWAVAWAVLWGVGYAVCRVAQMPAVDDGYDDELAGVMDTQGVALEVVALEDMQGDAVAAASEHRQVREEVDGQRRAQDCLGASGGVTAVLVVSSLCVFVCAFPLGRYIYHYESTLTHPGVNSLSSGGSIPAATSPPPLSRPGHLPGHLVVVTHSCLSPVAAPGRLHTTPPTPMQLPNPTQFTQSPTLQTPARPT